MSQLIFKMLSTLALSAALLLPFCATAEYIAVENAAEAGEVHVTWQQAGNGMARVKDCDACPLTLQIDAKTTFLAHGREISCKPARDFSGKPGTVIYDKQGKHALRILW